MRAQYLKVKSVDGETVEGETIEPQLRQPAGITMDDIFTGLAFGVCLLLGCAGGWFGHMVLEPARFSEAQESLISQGYTEAAQHLGEIDQICPNGKHAPIACRLLLMNGREISRKDDPLEVSYANPRH